MRVVIWSVCYRLRVVELALLSLSKYGWDEWVEAFRVFLEAQPGSIVIIRMTGTIMEGRFGTITSIEPKRQRWPVLFVVMLDMDWPDPELVDELHLAADEFRLVG